MHSHRNQAVGSSHYSISWRIESILLILKYAREKLAHEVSSGPHENFMNHITCFNGIMVTVIRGELSEAN